MKYTDRYVFFFGAQDVFSNWHILPFVYRSVSFLCVEQFMMYMKAMAFNDSRVAKQIMAATDPKSHKRLGRTVSNYNDEVWCKIRYNVVRVGLREKFKQNPDALKTLLETGTRRLVEASKYDLTWGCGLDENYAANTPEEDWPGLDLLGHALVDVRALLSKHI